MTVVPSSFLKKRRGPPEPPPAPVGTSLADPPATIQPLRIAASFQPAGVRKDTNVVPRQQALASGVASEVSDLLSTTQALTALQPVGSPLGLMGTVLSNILPTLSPGATALLEPVVSDWRVQASDSLVNGNPETSPQPVVLRPSLLTQLTPFLLQYGGQELQRLGTGVQNGLSAAQAGHAAAQAGNDRVHADLFNGYAALLQALGTTAENLASQGPASWSRMSQQADAAFLPEVSTVLALAAQTETAKYAAMCAEAQSAHTVARSDLESQRRHAEFLQRTTAVLAAVQGIVANGGKALPPLNLAAAMSSGAQAALQAETRRVQDRFRQRAATLQNPSGGTYAPDTSGLYAQEPPI